ncbi:MAG: sulfatase [Acidobacteriota bacterium]
MAKPVISRRNLLETTAGVIAASTGPLAKAFSFRTSNAVKPNVLLILTDQQTARAMSCTGNRHVQTPALDRLASSGIRFERSYCTSPVCSPARSSLITGRMPHETGVNHNTLPIKEDILNLGHLFRTAGYRTVWAGKWHLPRMFPHKFDPHLTQIPGFELMRFFDFSLPGWTEGKVTDPPLTDAVLGFLRHERQEKPLLLVVSYHNPHDICFVPFTPKRFPAPEKGELPPLPSNHTVSESEPEFVQQRRKLNRYGHQVLLTQDWSDMQWRNYVHHYYRFVEQVDAEIGRLLSAVETEGLMQKPLGLFTSDHGEGLAAHKWSSKLCFYEEAVAVPFILSWPGRVPEGKVDNQHLVSGLDVVSTLCDYAGVSAPALARGASLRKIVEHPGADWRDFVALELADDDKDQGRKGRAIVTARYKYAVYSRGARAEQLFDLSRDPGETANLADDASFRRVKEEHREKLKQWIRLTRDDFRLDPEA